MVFQILARIEMTRNRNWLFGRHFEAVQHFQNLFPELWFLIVHTYMVPISLQNSGGKRFFRGDSMEPPWAPTGVKKYLGRQVLRCCIFHLYYYNNVLLYFVLFL